MWLAAGVAAASSVMAIAQPLREPQPPVVFARAPGDLTIAPLHDAWSSLAVRLPVAKGKDAARFTIEPRKPVTVVLGDGAPTRALGGALDVPALQLRRADGKVSPPLSLHATGDALAFELRDGDGRAWLHVGHAMRSPDPADGLRIVTADLRGGPALSAWSGRDADGMLLGNVALRLPLPATAAAHAKSCAVPNWSTEPGFETDVILTDIDRVDVLRCRVLGQTEGAGCFGSLAHVCDGPGGEEGEVVIVPSATLSNSDTDTTADVPWHTKFSGVFQPWNNDQHPYLVWNLYRIDADGTLVQVARSGLKHAFATANTGCNDATCVRNGHILGRACADLYNAGSNDTWNALSPRNEVIASTGQWGRCGSVWDDRINQSGVPPEEWAVGCDGVQDAAPVNDCYRYRLVARETDIDPALHAGARWYVDAWYVVRDDVDIFSTMGWRELHPAWRDDLDPARWDVGDPGPFVRGHVVDAWLARTPPSQWSARGLLEAANGHVLVGTRVRRVDGGYRYDYAMMNLDLTHAQTDGAEPDLRVVWQAGIDRFAVSPRDGATASARDFRDGDADAGNDWSAAVEGDDVAWLAPDAAAQLAWGSLAGFTLVSPHPPGPGHVRVSVPGIDAAALADIEALVPDGRQVLRDGFE